MDAENKTIFTKNANDEKLGRTKNLNQFCKWKQLTEGEWNPLGMSTKLLEKENGKYK